MIYKISKIQYLLYFILVILTYITSSNIVPPLVKWPANKMWYLVFFAATFFLIYGTRAVVSKKIVFPILVLFIYSICVTISYFLNFGILWALIYSLVGGLFYFILFYYFSYLCQNFSVKELMLPFLVVSVFILLMSFLVVLGYQPNFYLNDSDQLDSYLNLKFGGGLIGFSGIYLNQNSFSIILMISIISIFLMIADGKDFNYKIRFLLFSFLLLSLGFLFLTMSRAAIFSSLILFMLFFIRGIRSKLNFYIIIFSVFFIVSILFIFNDFFDFFLSRIQNDGTSNRIDIWTDAWQVFKRNLYFGVGIYEYINSAGSKLSTHNVYINILVSFGFFAFFSWVSWVFIGVWKAFLILVKVNFFENKVDVFISLSFLSILIHQMFENTIVNTFSPLALFFMMLIALVINRGKSF